MKRIYKIFSIAASLLGVVLASVILRAHGGEDHGAAEAPAVTSASAGGPNYLSKETQFALEVYTDAVQERELPYTLKVFGLISAPTNAKASVSAPIDGRVSAVRSYKIGDVVSKGQTLFSIQQIISGTERLALEQELVSAEREYDEAIRDLNRKEALQEIVSQRDLEIARIRAASATRQVENLRARLSTGTKFIAVTAPISGVVTATSLVNGEFVDVTRQLLQIADLSRVWIEAQIYESDVQIADAAMSAVVSVPTSSKTYIAKRIAKGDTVQQESRTITYIYEVMNPNGELKLNGSATILIGGNETASVLSVPKSALILQGGRTFVAVHSAPETFIPTEVLTGKRNDNSFVEVTSGVSSGDRVATTNLNLFKQGLP